MWGDDLLVGGDGDDLLSGDATMSLVSPPYPPLFDAPFFDNGLPIPIGGGLLNVGGNDTLDGGAGNDIMIGDGGTIRGTGRGGNDTMLGGDGDDRMYGDAYIGFFTVPPGRVIPDAGIANFASAATTTSMAATATTPSSAMRSTSRASGSAASRTAAAAPTP